MRAAKLTVSNAQGEYEQLEKDREAEEMKALGGKRNLEDGDQADGEPAAKRAKGDEADDEEMEIEMDMDDDDAEGEYCFGSDVGEWYGADRSRIRREGWQICCLHKFTARM